MHRRDLLKLPLAAVGLAAATAPAATAPAAATCPGDGTPAQFSPKRAPDPRPLDGDLRKAPLCPYCGMDRRRFHSSRMVIHYSDDLADGVCSLHCAAISLSLNVDREPKAIYVANNASAVDPMPLVEAAKATFLIGSQIKGVMTKRSKVAFGSEDAAKASLAADGGELGDFDKALLAAYIDMAQDVAMIRRLREERRKKAMRKPG